MKTLRRKIVVPTVLVTAVVGLALGTVAWDAARRARSFERDARAVRSATALAVALADAAQEEDRSIASYSWSWQGDAHATRVLEADAHMAELMSRIAALPPSPSRRAGQAWEQFAAAREMARSVRDGVLAAAASGDAQELARALEKWRLMSGRTAALLKNYTALQLRLLDETVAESQRRRTRSLWTGAAAVLLGLLIASAFSLAVARTVVDPIVGMAKAAERITATGPPSPVRGAERQDEIGVLARAFNAMTERLVAANASLAAAVRERDDFISVASHELKTPITPLQLRVQQLLRVSRRGAGPAIAREEILPAMQNLDKHVVKLGKLVDSLLDVSRITSGRLALRLDEVSLLEVVRDALERASDELAAAGCEPRIESQGDLRIRADRSRLEQILVNIVGNAAKYAPRGPVVIRVSADRSDATIEVEDRGPGVAPEDRDRIFTRFERAVSHRDEVAGLGLGLFIAREIARAHGGEITVRSEPGQGATFVLRLPLDASGFQAQA